ncbi:GNAT family N-acetyltransferase [Corynebacterium heidelbergense]|uniref:GNAT family N-acetyltransferase n=1 Tax=Corynebacterium heidelbergense TaxID=2055947 RepID=A0A364VAD4_9CORY|nr:GNAT family N-acetyltransferase [Corynebacterium heidelbergense]RAV33633.1 GNAT family N-acetyltransferase [Corynebacterium heidelbergense]WCZ36844.1 putative acetyltransferase [Corynebacterium heidelbergense]
MAVEIRRAEERDYAAVEGLFLKYLEFYGRDDSTTRSRAPQFLRDRFTRVDSRRYVAQVADEAEPTTVGFVQVYFGFSSVRLDYWWILNDLYVQKEHRGLGAGRDLVRRVCEEAADDGASRVVLETEEANVSARKLYESLGFRQTGSSGEYLSYELDLA